MFTLTTPDYESLEPDGGGGDGGPTIPLDLTCANPDAGGYGVSPELDWSGAPPGTQSFTIVLRDLTNGCPTIGCSIWYHWAIWDIPATATALPAGLPPGLMLTSPVMAQETSFMGSMGQFTGPCPGGSIHVYQFEIFAIPTATLGVKDTAGEGTVQTVFNMANQQALGTALITGKSNAKHY